MHSHSFEDTEMTSQVRQIFQGRGRGEVDDSTVPPEGSRIKG